MKNVIIPCLLLACIGLQSCKKEQTQKVDAPQTVAEKIVNVECYKAIYEKDTIDLKLNTLESGKVSGDMVMKVANAQEKTGNIKGEFHGDTLFVDYTFVEGKEGKNTFKNPMALLKKDKQLIIGNGTIQTTMGVSYLVKDQPIDFDRVKYKFSATDCPEVSK